MKGNKRRVLSISQCLCILLTGLYFSLGGIEPALAKELEKGAKYPVRPIRIMIPAAAGGGLGGEIRAIAPFLEKNLGTTVVIDYLPAADGVIAYNKFYQDKPDGYTLLYYNLISALPFEMTRETAKYVVKNFTHLGGWNVKYQVLLVNPDTWKTFGEFLAEAKKRTLSLGGTGGHTVLNAHVLEAALGVKFNRVPYRSAGEGIAAVAGKHVDCVMTYETAPRPMIQAGRLRPLAVLSQKPDPLLPGVPNLKELGHEDVTIIPSYGVFAAPPHTPAGIAATLERALQKVVVSPEFAKIADNIGLYVNFMPSADLGKAALEQYDILGRYKQFLK